MPLSRGTVQQSYDEGRVVLLEGAAAPLGRSGGDLCSARDAELAKDVGGVAVYRPLADEERPPLWQLVSGQSAYRA